MAFEGRWFDPLDALSQRLTGLLGVLWFTGGAVVLASSVGGTYALGRPAGVVAVGILALVVGVVLLAVRERVLPTAAYASLTLLGAGLIAVVVLWAGPTGAGAPGVLYVFVSCFAFISLRALAPMIVAVSAGLHLLALLVSDAPAPFGTWLLVWGVALVAGVVVGRVVGAQRRLVAEQERLVGQLEDADTTKTAFLYAVSHELARPMTAFIGLAETLAWRGDDLPPADRAVLAERLVDSSRRLDRMREDLLDLGRLTRGGVALDLEDSGLDDVIDDAIGLAGVDPTAIEVTDVSGVVIRADRTKLAHALANLLDNADKYGGEAPLAVEVMRRADGVVVCVADRGPGVPDALKERVFEPFERAQEEDAHRGTGLGLALVREFAGLQGGRAWLEDRPGGGTRACVWLPCEPKHVAGGDDGAESS